MLCRFCKISFYQQTVCHYAEVAGKIHSSERRSCSQDNHGLDTLQSWLYGKNNMCKSWNLAWTGLEGSVVWWDWNWTFLAYCKFGGNPTPAHHLENIIPSVKHGGGSIVFSITLGIFVLLVWLMHCLQCLRLLVVILKLKFFWKAIIKKNNNIFFLCNWKKWALTLT